MESPLRLRTVNEIIDERPLSRFQATTIVLCGLVSFLDGFDAQSIGFLVPPISEQLGIPMSAFGPVLAAGLFGLMLGTMLGGLIADRWGRRWPIIGSAAGFGIFSLLTAGSSSLNELMIFRFLTGVALGGAMPNLVALASEFAPARLQTTLVTMLFGGMGGGALLAGMSGWVLIPLWGWRSVLYLGGGLPILLTIPLMWRLPESVRFLTVRGADPRRISAILGGISPELARVAVRPPTVEKPFEGVLVKHLFTEGRAAGTLLLWVPYFMNLLLMFFILSWLPAVLRTAGMPVSAGVLAISVFGFGNMVGSFAQGRLMTSIGASRVLLTEFSTCIVMMGFLGYILTSLWVMLIVTFILGVCVPGAQAGLNALAAAFYPTPIRSTGVGWALGIGRLGSIVGPVIGGQMLAMSWTPPQIFLAGVVPAMIAAGAIVVSIILPRKASAYRRRVAPMPAAAMH